MSNSENNDLEQYEEPWYALLQQVRSLKYKILLALRFYILFPNGQRVPIEQSCEAVQHAMTTGDTSFLPLRTFGDRMVLILEAALPTIFVEGLPEEIWNFIAPTQANDQEYLYWRQAFYLSTGTSSGKGGTWLPFDGITLGIDKPDRQTYHMSEFAKRKNGREGYRDQTWFDKKEFNFPVGVPDEYNILARLYNSFYHNCLLIDGSRMERYGSLSYLLASSKLGGSDMAEIAKKWRNLSLSKWHVSHGEADETMLQESIEFAKLFQVPHLLEPCFQGLSQNLGIVSPETINDYIDNFQGCWYYNKLVGVTTPPLSSYSVLVPSVQIHLPIFHFKNKLIRIIKQAHFEHLLYVFTNGKLGASTDQINQELQSGNFLRNTNGSSLFFNEGFERNINVSDEFLKNPEGRANANYFHESSSPLNALVQAAPVAPTGVMIGPQGDIVYKPNTSALRAAPPLRGGRKKTRKHKHTKRAGKTRLTHRRNQTRSHYSY